MLLFSDKRRSCRIAFFSILYSWQSPHKGLNHDEYNTWENVFAGPPQLASEIRERERQQVIVKRIPKLGKFHSAQTSQKIDSHHDKLSVGSVNLKKVIFETKNTVISGVRCRAVRAPPPPSLDGLGKWWKRKLKLRKAVMLCPKLSNLTPGYSVFSLSFHYPRYCTLKNAVKSLRLKKKRKKKDMSDNLRRIFQQKTSGTLLFHLQLSVSFLLHCKKTTAYQSSAEVLHSPFLPNISGLVQF